MNTFSFLQDLKFFSHTEMNFLLDIIICLVIAFAIGVERESRGKDAGISTNSFVIFGAMLFTFISTHVDPASSSRIAAQIVSGIGFLGAGLIIKEGTDVRNLTTAASIWFSAAIGMAVGFGFYFIAVMAALVSIIIPRIPHINKNYFRDDNEEMTIREKDELRKNF